MRVRTRGAIATRRPTRESRWTFSEALVRFLLDLVAGALPVPDERGPKNPKRMCRAFLELVGSEPHSPARERSARELEQWARDPKWCEIAWLFERGADIVEIEVADALGREHDLRTRLSDLATALEASRARSPATHAKLIRHFWEVFLPDAVGVVEDWEPRILELRRRRTVDIESLCSAPVEHPARDLLWTSNVLLTVHDPDTSPGDLHLEPGFLRRLESIDSGEQKYWYDHPVQIGVAPERNEILYGLRGMSEMLRFEKKRRAAGPTDRLSVALSVSVTHPGLESVAREYVQGALAQANDTSALDVYVFTEADTRRLAEDFLCPAARLFDLEGQEPRVLHRHLRCRRAVRAALQLPQGHQCPPKTKRETRWSWA